ncbi:MAG: TetR/AcrR family transcriptional regulator [Desulfobacterales bacterium]|nr:TetR/AcrR family transcriptional regulator [Desulfobacterales bacterium]
MKISKERKQENRRLIIQAAVELMIKKGARAATMREIAGNAGIGTATIYNYFPTKEAILFAYYEDHFQNCMEKIQSIDGFNEFSLQEQLQTLIETSLTLFLPDREFVEISFKTTFFTMSQNFHRLKPARDLFIRMVQDMFEAAVEVGEIPGQMFQDLLYQLFWDFYVGMVIYWLSDASDRFTDTSVLIDKSLDLTCAMLKAGVANKVFDIATFLFKNHVLNRMNFIKERFNGIHEVKRAFMGGAHGG